MFPFVFFFFDLRFLFFFIFFFLVKFFLGPLYILLVLVHWSKYV